MNFKKPFRAVPIELGEVYRSKARRERWKRRIPAIALALSAFVLVFGGGMLATNWSVARAMLSASSEAEHFELCGVVRRTCVVDGDTFWLHGEKIRVADIDTPEISEPKCDAEYELGISATYRFRDLLNEGPFELQSIGNRDNDQYGRLLRVVVRDGRSLGDILVEEGLARTWTGRRQPWC